MIYIQDFNRNESFMCHYQGMMGKELVKKFKWHKIGSDGNKMYSFFCYLHY